MYVFIYNLYTYHDKYYYIQHIILYLCVIFIYFIYNIII